MVLLHPDGEGARLQSVSARGAVRHRQAGSPRALASGQGQLPDWRRQCARRFRTGAHPDLRCSWNGKDQHHRQDARRDPQAEAPGDRLRHRRHLRGEILPARHRRPAQPARCARRLMVALGRCAARLSLRPDRGVHDPRQDGRSFLGEGCAGHAGRRAPEIGEAGTYPRLDPARHAAPLQAEGSRRLRRRHRCGGVHIDRG